MNCPKRKIAEFIGNHDLEKYYENNALVNKYLPQTVKKKKNKKVKLFILVTGLLAAVAGVAYFLLKDREDFYGDDFFDDDDLFFDDEDFDLYEEDLEEEFEDVE